VGGVNDPSGQTGIAHMLEHMMFKGTGTFGTLNYAAERPLMERLDELNLALQQIQYDSQTSPLHRADAARVNSLKREIAETTSRQKRYIVKNELFEAYSRLAGTGLNAM